MGRSIVQPAPPHLTLVMKSSEELVGMNPEELGKIVSSAYKVTDPRG